MVDEDAPQILMDPSAFMLALLSMTDIEYQLWRNGIPYATWVTDELDYDELTDTCLMPFLTTIVCVLIRIIYFHFPCIASHEDI